MGLKELIRSRCNYLLYRLARIAPSSRTRLFFLRRCSGVHIGRDVYLGPHVTLTRTTTEDILFIGERATLAPNVTLLPASGPVHSRLQALNHDKRERIVIEDDAWIGTGVIVMPGIRIGKCSICAAGSVIIRDVEPYSIVGGVPARIIRRIDPEVLEQR